MFANLISYYREMDQFFFKKINQDWSFPLGNVFFPLITDFQKLPVFLYVLLPLTILLILYFQRMKGLKFLLVLALALTVSDTIAFRVIKQIVHRPRPAHTGMVVALRVEDSGGPSFPSNHATNMFAAAGIVSFVFPPYAALAFFYAACVAYSRVYVGVHYPSDVLAGAILGTLISFLVWRLTRNFFIQKQKKYAFRKKYL